MVICLERGADLHMAQLMPLLLTASCFSKIQIGFTFLVPAHPGSPGKRAVKRVCVCHSNKDRLIDGGRWWRMRRLQRLAAAGCRVDHVITGSTSSWRGTSPTEPAVRCRGAPLPPHSTRSASPGVARQVAFAAEQSPLVAWHSGSRAYSRVVHGLG